MYLDKVKAKGRYYLYLKMYDSKVTYSSDKRITLYGFGREEKALKNMYLWLNDITNLPTELKKLGCNETIIKSWISKLEGNRKKYSKLHIGA